MFINVYTISIIFSIVFLVVVVELVRKNKLQERYSLLWIFMSIILLVLSSTPVIINKLAEWLDIKNPPSFLFLFGLVYLLIYNLHLTVVVSKQSEKITRLVQEIALLKESLSKRGKQCI
ncbi:MAG: DUF2304 domain-containing protein [Firmicutes bacterium]|nr:DUF2304 domain-containing protein [Bacillota bacterium]